MPALPHRASHVFVLFVCFFRIPFAFADETKSNAAAESAKVSYAQQIRPIFQANCQGCHQPAKAGGHYVMTSVELLLKGGESGAAAIATGKPDDSNLLKLITPVDGKAEMPKGKSPLSAAEIDLIRTWIVQGAVDDSSSSATQKFDQDHPPEYSKPPVVTSIDFSSDGSLLAVAGFHEVLLVNVATGELAGRLVGLSERLESVRFSPDGKRLAATGGLPGRMGEIQIWDVATKSLTLSVPATFDTVYGGNWSSDGKLIAFGGADNVVRVIDTTSGDQVLQNGSHSDWVLDTGFSPDDSHLISVSRDMTAKLTEVATQRFVDNITSITPGALKGGIQAVASVPNRDEILVGGSDGVPKIYQLYRKTARVIGDDANLLRSLTAMRGRIFGLATTRDGLGFAASSALDGSGQVFVFRFDPAQFTEEIKTILAKPFATRTSVEKDAVQNYFKTATLAESKIEIPANVYAVAFRPDGQILAAAGSDGIIRLINPVSGEITKEFSPAPVSQRSKSPATSPTVVVKSAADKVEAESLPSGSKVVALEVVPDKVRLTGPADYTQLLVVARLDTGDQIDATRLSQFVPAGSAVSVSPTGTVRAVANGTELLTVKLADQSVSVPVEVVAVSDEFHPDFIRDVGPILSRVGCNQGTCHGSVKGKNGFKLSLRGYDPIFDVRALTDDLSSRRVNVASPDSSLMLLKSTGAVPHVGGQVLQQGEMNYEVIRRWIQDGAKLDQKTPRVVKIDVFPHNPVVQLIGAKQQLRVTATYADGLVRDVTREAFVESGNTEVAVAERGGLLKSLRRGEAAMLVRYEGNYAATILTVMGDRSGFVWSDPPINNKIDELTAAKWKLMKIQPSPLASDADFIRRVYIDLIGLPPRPEKVRAFLADSRDTQTKRDELIDRLVGSDDYVEYWSNKWADLLQVNGKFLAREGASAFRNWIRDEVAANTPYDQFAQKVITATGSNREVPPASYFKILREPTATTENTMQLFLGIRFNCNKCHDHPFERWTQDQYYETAAYFAQFGLDRDPASGDRNIGGTAVEGAKPIYETVVDRPTGDVIHERTSKPASPKFPFELSKHVDSNAAAAGPRSRRVEFSDWLASRDNPYFAKSYVNRLWGYLFGVGIIEPIDDIRAGNPATNPELLNYLTQEFISSNFNVQHVMRLICKSRTYQLSVETGPYNVDDKINYSHCMPRRLPAEVLYDTIHRVTGSTTRIPGVAAGTRAAALPDSGIDVASGFFATFGRPARESACECERSGGMQLGPITALISGATLSEAIADPNNEITQLVATTTDDNQLVNELTLRILNRPAGDAERKAFADAMSQLDGDHQKLAGVLKARESQLSSLMPELKKRRDDSIARTKQEIADYEKELAPRLAEMEKKRQENIAARQANITAYDTRLPGKVEAWEKTQSVSVDWMTLLPSFASGTKETTVTIESDRSINVESKDARNVILTAVMPTTLKNITAIRLEAIASDKAPNGGPGRASDGNFVLTEFELFIKKTPPPVEGQPAANPQYTKVDLHKPLADFSQANYEIAKAITGNPNDGGKGWAISPAYGVTHWATFECKQPINLQPGEELRVRIHHKFGNPDYVLGRFRISVATDKVDVGLSLADEYRAILMTEPARRSASQVAALAKHFKAIDREFLDLQAALGEANAPLPPDSKLVDLQNKLELVSQPIPADGRLAQLQADMKNSESQLANKRLTASQDVVWALMNTPAFLFNR